MGRRGGPPGKQGETEKALRKSFGAAVEPGKQALEAAHRKQVADEGARITCSLYFDRHLESKYRNTSRWDYLLAVGEGPRDRPVAIEVHPATADRVRDMLRKQAGTRKILGECCPTVQIADYDWHWLASGDVYLSPRNPQHKLLNQNGITEPVKHLRLKG